MERDMQQLEMFCTIKKFTPLEQLARHMRMFRVDFTYDELQEWHATANELTQRVRKANEVAPDEESSLAYQWYNR